MGSCDIPPLFVPSVPWDHVLWGTTLSLPLAPWPGNPGIPTHSGVSGWAEDASSAAPTPALAPPPLPCCSVQCQPAVTRDLLVCTAGFIEHRKEGSGR